MKKAISLILSAVLLLALLAGCGSGAQKQAASATDVPTEAPQQTAQPAAETPAPAHYPVTISTYNYAKEEVKVTFDKCPQRVVCTNQTQTELMLYFGLDEYIVGTAYLDGEIREDLKPQYEALKAAGKELTVKGYPAKEVVLALEPDFIFGWRSAFAEDQLGDVSEWHDLGVGTMILRCSNNTAPVRDLEAVLADIADIGAIFNIEDKTNAFLRQARALMARIDAKVSALEAPCSAIIIEPFGGTFYCWGEKTLTGGLVVAAGAAYALPDGGDLSLEDIINLNPDVIIVDYMDDENLTPEESKAQAIASITGEAALAEVNAVLNGKVMAINLTDVYGGGIRMVPSVETMFNFMYGDEAPAKEHYPVTISTYNYAKEEVEVTFDKCPQRVVCTNQTQTELMLYFGLDEYIVGTAYLDGEIREDLKPQYEALKAAGKELTVKGYPAKEVVLALEPDFIFGWRSAFAEDQLGDVSEWHDLGVGTMILRCSNNTAPVRDLEAVLADIADIGAIFNIEDKTNAFLRQARALMARIDAKVSALEAPCSAIIIEPFGGTFYCWGEKTLTGGLVVAAGAAYALPDGGDLSLEDIINLNPDVIIVDYMDDENLTPEESKAQAIASITGEAALAEVNAVLNGKVMAINLTDVYGGGIRMVPSVETMFNFMYGD